MRWLVAIILAVLLMSVILLAFGWLLKNNQAAHQKYIEQHTSLPCQQFLMIS